MSRRGYNAMCKMQTCTKGCCAADGYCPVPSSSNFNKKYCKYYYSYSYSSTSTGVAISGGGGAIAGIVVGGVVGLIVLIVGIVFCVKKCRGNQAEQSIAQPQAELNVTQASFDPNIHNQSYNQPYNQPYVMPANQTNGQPYMIPPTQQYGQPYVQPMNQPYPQPPNPFVAAMDPMIGQPVNYGNYEQPQANPPKYGNGPIVQ